MNLDTLLISLRSQVTPLWYQFGLAAGIDKEILDKYHEYPPEVCIVEVMDHWLRSGSPTWQDVAEILKDLQLSDLAEDIING